MPSEQEVLTTEEKRDLFKQEDSEFCSKVSVHERRVKRPSVYHRLLPFQYEQKNQISSGAFSSVFCIKQLRKKNKILYAAKYLKASREAAKREVEILVKLRRCNQVVTFIEVYQCQFYTILVTEYLPGTGIFS